MDGFAGDRIAQAKKRSKEVNGSRKEEQGIFFFLCLSLGIGMTKTVSRALHIPFLSSPLGVSTFGRFDVTFRSDEM
jgi:hypothetical protein